MRSALVLILLSLPAAAGDFLDGAAVLGASEIICGYRFPRGMKAAYVEKVRLELQAASADEAVDRIKTETRRVVKSAADRGTAAQLCQDTKPILDAANAQNGAHRLRDTVCR